eukprot:TRINITY_DN67008_c0_g1_i1.p2 TRINITY_DN67008_c0_g1~~TRINITY_DN67008_c0_g1_i1.p2  ORF type:complete len:141 (+),score=24.31 TRINITY_DN67008_c0_g1_i1:103-525(+)
MGGAVSSQCCADEATVEETKLIRPNVLMGAADVVSTRQTEIFGAQTEGAVLPPPESTESTVQAMQGRYVRIKDDKFMAFIVGSKIMWDQRYIIPDTQLVETAVENQVSMVLQEKLCTAVWNPKTETLTWDDGEVWQRREK